LIWLSLVLSFILTFGIYYLIIFFYKKKIKRKGSIWLRLEKKIKRKRLNKALFVALIIFMGSSIHFACYNASNRIAFSNLSLSGQSHWVNNNGQKYLYIEADNHYDLGYHTGYHLSTEIVKMKYLIQIYTMMIGIEYSNFKNQCLDYLSYIPEEYKQEMQGIGDGATAGGGFFISFTDIVIQSVFYEVLYGRIAPSKLSVHSTLGCTALGARNFNGSIIIGQTIDLVKPFEWIQSFVLHKLKGEPLVFTYRIGGCPALPMGRNEYGLTLITNLVQTKITAPITKPTFVVVREGLAKNRTIESFYSTLLNNNNSAYSRNFIIANNTNILAIQSLPENHTSFIPISTIVQSNTFINPYWQNYLIDSNYSKHRQVFAEDLMTLAYNNIELTNLELLDILRSQPIICRDESGLIGMKTVAFMTMKSFGLGTPNGNIAKIPI
jgi:hypothetical protein